MSKKDGFILDHFQEIEPLLENIQNLEKDNLEAKKLLQEAVYFINQVPNKKYKTSTGESSYQLASKIDKYLNKVKNDTGK